MKTKSANKIGETCAVSWAQSIRRVTILSCISAFIATMAVFCSYTAWADDPEEVWTFYGEQASLSVGATVLETNHTLDPFPGQVRTIRVAPTLTTWGYYMSNLGHVISDAVVTETAPQTRVRVSPQVGASMKLTSGRQASLMCR